MLDPNLSAGDLRKRWNAQREASRKNKVDKRDYRNHLNTGIAGSRYNRETLPFCAVDGEGGGARNDGRQKYLLLRAGEHVLFNSNADLTTDDCLGFLASLPPDRIYVAFYFDYDVTMILRDVGPERRDRILCKGGLTAINERRATYVGNYEVEYLPRKYFRVRHAGKNDTGRNIHPWVTINECGPFFQCSFVKAVTDWQCGSAHERSLIADNKARRAVFDVMTDVEIEYNNLECKLLQELMEKFRFVCGDTGYIPARWQGPGYLASDMLKRQGVAKTREYGLDPELLSYANAAYYGGRFELFKVGLINNVHEYDINSAYPYAMLSLPCLMHGSWYHEIGAPKTDDLFVADIQFTHDTTCAVCHFPIRDKKSGTIYWPRHGNGWYWGEEIRAAIETGTVKVTYRDHWRYEKKCDCKPFEWIKQVYEMRKAIGKGTKGYALKLAINSLYGKTAQSIGSAPYANPIWAGMITAMTRSMLIRAYAAIDSRDIVMLATDGIYTRCPLPALVEGAELGQWESKLHDEMFLIQPGIYFSSAAKARPKTRGVAMSVVLEHEQRFRDIWSAWIAHAPIDLLGNIGAFPSVEVPMHLFIGMKLAQAWNKPGIAGTWLDTTRNISFDFRTKRQLALIEPPCIHTYPRAGSAELTTAPYSRTIGAWQEQAAEMSAIISDQPDMFAFAPHEQE